MSELAILLPDDNGARLCLVDAMLVQRGHKGDKWGTVTSFAALQDGEAHQYWLIQLRGDYDTLYRTRMPSALDDFDREQDDVACAMARALCAQHGERLALEGADEDLA